MLGFSEYLQNYMKTNSISMVELSKEVDIDRTVIYRYVKGTRVPSDLNIVVRIADAIQMSVSEKKELLREYDKLVFGESVVYSYQYIHKLLWNLEKLDIESVPMNSWRSVHELKMDAPIVELKAREEIVTYLMDFFQFLSEQNNAAEKILLIMQPVYDEIQRFILWNFRESNMAIEQILCMEQNVNQSYKNLEVFYEIIPLCFSLSKYNVYYYYDALNSHINNMMVMPNVLIAQDYVVQFDYKMEQGIVVKDATYAAAMRKQYQSMLAESRSLLVRGKDPETFSEQAIECGNKISRCLSKQLCMAACLDRELLERCIYPVPGKEKFIEMLLGTRGRWEGMQFIDSEYETFGMVSYGNGKGMEEFMVTGRIKEIPEMLYEPLSSEERMRVLKRMIFLAENGKIHYHIISDKVELPDRVQAYWDENRKSFVLNQVVKEEIRHIAIEEQSIYRTFQMYLEYLEKKELIYSEPESLDYLIKLQKKYERKFM